MIQPLVAQENQAPFDPRQAVSAASIFGASFLFFVPGTIYNVLHIPVCEATWKLVRDLGFIAAG